MVWIYDKKNGWTIDFVLMFNGSSFSYFNDETSSLINLRKMYLSETIVFKHKVTQYEWEDGSFYEYGG